MLSFFITFVLTNICVVVYYVNKFASKDDLEEVEHFYRNYERQKKSRPKEYYS